MEWEYKQLRAEHAGCQKSLRICRKQLAAERNNFRKLVLAVSERLEQSSLAVRQVEEEKDEQLVSLSGELVRLHASLLQERKRILAIIQEKDRIIESQKRELESLRRQQSTWPVRLAAAESGQAALATTAAKPPVPSRDRVNRKLHIGGPPPPPPPRGVSLQQAVTSSPRGGNGASVAMSPHGGASVIKFGAKNNEEADDSGLGWPLGRMAVVEVTASDSGRRGKGPTAYPTIGCDREIVETVVVDKEADDKFDSGRESDETFDSESVKSESATTDGKKRRPATIELVADKNVTVVRASDKTRVTFWTDTYL